MSTGVERSRGTLTSWDDERGFGFVESLAGARVFAHISAFPARAERPQHGESLSYVVERGDDGKTRAIDIRYTGPSAQNPRAGTRTPPRGAQSSDRRAHPSGRRTGRSAGPASYLAIVVFIAFALYVNANWPLPLWIVAVYALASLACFILYALDKSAAKRGSWRVPENTLHLLAVLGGWPGAICAQQLLRHKTQKASFRAVFWVTVVVNVLVFAVVTTPIGGVLLAAVDG